MNEASYVCGRGERALSYETMGQALARTAENHGNREALVVAHQGIRWSWRELADQVATFAAGLDTLGLEPGERVGIWAPNRYEWVVAQFATARAGLILVNLNPAYRSVELEFALNEVGCRALILAERLRAADYLATLDELAPELSGAKPGMLNAARLPALRWVITLGQQTRPGCLTFTAVAARADQAAYARITARQAALQPDDPINIQFTSGTTGAPKGATLTHFNILNNGAFVAERMQLAASDRLCIPVPLYHCFGMVMGVLGCLAQGTTMVFPEASFEARSVLEAVEAERCSALYGVPTMFIAELEHPEFARFDLSTLRTGIMAGAPCPREVMQRVIDAMHMTEITICYGMTETSPVSLQSHPDDPLDKRVATVGRIHPYVETKIVDDAQRLVARGTTGELCTRGYSVMRGYWGAPERTQDAVDAAGWMHTGDLAVMDAEGYVEIVGRLKDMIIRGGENIYPREIEDYLYGHPEVEDVAVFGVPDERYGEAVATWVKLRGGASIEAQALIEYCRGRIAHYKVPKYLDVVNDFPMTITGKLQKFRMREAMIARLGLHTSAAEPPYAKAAPTD